VTKEGIIFSKQQNFGQEKKFQHGVMCHNPILKEV
jgi:hypothetical protein